MTLRDVARCPGLEPARAVLRAGGCGAWPLRWAAVLPVSSFSGAALAASERALDSIDEHQSSVLRAGVVQVSIALLLLVGTALWLRWRRRPRSHNKPIEPSAPVPEPSSYAKRRALGHEIGDTVAGKYRLNRVLGEGGMGIVFEAEHVRLHHRVAIKMLKVDAAGSADSLARIEREGAATSQLRHRNILRVSDVDTLEDGTPYMVMEYLEGWDLAEELLQRGPLPVDEAVNYVLEACSGIAHAHALGIVHRDLKPSNLFLNFDGFTQSIKVVDFGISKSLADSHLGLTVTRTCLGSPLYMSPEQIRNAKDVDGRADIWSLGVILYELLAATPPFIGESLPAVAVAISADEPAPLAERRASVPPELEATVRRALTKDRTQRFQSVSELAQALLPYASKSDCWSAPSSRQRPTAQARVDSLRFADTLTESKVGAMPNDSRTGDTLPSVPRQPVHVAARLSVPPGLPPSTIDRRQHNLPAMLTHFVGREAELLQLPLVLAQQRLVTLAGPGGAGKTRLALELGAALIDKFMHGVWFVDLGPLGEDALVLPAVAHAMGAREEAGKPLAETLTRFFEDRELLLILDNCEHLLKASASLADTLVRQCRRVRVLTTSREPLGVSGEHAWRVAPLAIPAPEASDDLSALTACESVRFFVDRARAARPDFQLTPESSVLVAEVCRRLDGIPLALELAAARLRFLSLETLASRLDSRFRLLSSGSRTALPRHQTLQAAVDWSYELLGQTARTLFRRLAVFRAGCTLESAEYVCVGAGVEKHDVLNLLTELADKSLVVVDAFRREPRYRLLETLREYAEARLAESGEQSQVRERFAQYFLALAEPSRVAGMGAERALLTERLHLEYSNLRAVLEMQTSTEGQLRLAVRLAIGLGPYWWDRSRFAEGAYWTGQLLERFPVDGSAVERAWLSYWAASPAEAFERRRELLRLALDLFREAGEQRGVAYALNDMGVTAMDRGWLQEANRHYAESLAIRRGLGDEGEVAIVLCNLGETACAIGDIARGEALFSEAVALHREQGGSGYLADALYNLGDLALRRDDLCVAERTFCEGLRVAMATSSGYYAIKALIGFGRLALRRDDAASAVRIFGAAERSLEALGTALETYARVPYEQDRATSEQRLEAQVWQRSYELGRKMTLAEVVAQCLSEAASRAA